MSRRRTGRRTSALAMISVLSAAVLAMSACTASATGDASPGTERLRVVSLGDSYSTGTGPGSVPLADAAVCGRTVDASIRVAAERVGAQLVNAACDGATTADLTAPTQRGDRLVAPQLDALQGGADVVLVRFGGNDLGFPELVGRCLAQDPDGPVADGAASCSAALAPAGGVDSVRARIDGEVSDRLAAAYASIRDAAPDARIVVLGYLSVLGDPDALPADGCLRATADSSVNGRVLLTDRDAAYLAGVQRDLAAAIQRTAEAAGFRYVDQATPTLAHGSCAGDDGDPYVAGIGGSAGATPLHPNAAGLAWEAGVVADVLREEASARS